MSWLLTRTLRFRLDTALRVAVPWTQVHGYLGQRYLIWGALQLPDTPTPLKGGVDHFLPLTTSEGGVRSQYLEGGSPLRTILERFSGRNPERN